mmetsp:Transcript_47294/g.109439  ORF Transcript_47294/g.109439 Transcript_47294/m.109439 type:complete len:300 (-) Transcript_47294:338-1237(-)
MQRGNVNFKVVARAVRRVLAIQIECRDPRRVSDRYVSQGLERKSMASSVAKRLTDCEANDAPEASHPMGHEHHAGTEFDQPLRCKRDVDFVLGALNEPRCAQDAQELENPQEFDASQDLGLPHGVRPVLSHQQAKSLERDEADHVYCEPALQVSFAQLDWVLQENRSPLTRSLNLNLQEELHDKIDDKEDVHEPIHDEESPVSGVRWEEHNLVGCDHPHEGEGSCHGKVPARNKVGSRIQKAVRRLQQVSHEVCHFPSAELLQIAVGEAFCAKAGEVNVVRGCHSKNYIGRCPEYVARQ